MQNDLAHNVNALRGRFSDLADRVHLLSGQAVALNTQIVDFKMDSLQPGGGFKLTTEMPSAAPATSTIQPALIQKRRTPIFKATQEERDETWIANIEATAKRSGWSELCFALQSQPSAFMVS